MLVYMYTDAWLHLLKTSSIRGARPTGGGGGVDVISFVTIFFVLWEIQATMQLLRPSKHRLQTRVLGTGGILLYGMFLAH